MRMLREIGLPALALVLGAATTFGVGMLLLPAPSATRSTADAGGPTSLVTSGTAFQPGTAEGATPTSMAAPDDDSPAAIPAAGAAIGDAGSGGAAWPISTGSGVPAAPSNDPDVPAGGSDDDDSDDGPPGDPGSQPARPVWAAPTGMEAGTLRAEVGEITYVRCGSPDAGRPTPGDRCGRLPAIERRVTQLLARDAGRCVRAIEPDADTLRLALEVRFDLGTLRVWAGQASTLQGVGGVVHCMRRILLSGPEGTPRFSLDGISHREERYTLFVSLRFSPGESQRSAPSSTNR